MTVPLMVVVAPLHIERNVGPPVLSGGGAPPPPPPAAPPPPPPPAPPPPCWIATGLQASTRSASPTADAMRMHVYAPSPTKTSRKLRAAGVHTNVRTAAAGCCSARRRPERALGRVE